MEGKQACVSKDLPDGYKDRKIQDFIKKSNVSICKVVYPGSSNLHNLSGKCAVKLSL